MHNRTFLFLLLIFSFSTVFSQKNDQSCESDPAFLGINYEKLSSEKAKILGFKNPYGDYITKVIKNTAAERAGLQIFDYIYGMDDYRVERENNLGKALKKYHAGDKAIVHFYRKGRALSAEVVFGSRSDVSKEPKSEAFFGVSQHSLYKANERGVKVNVIERSTAEALGLEKGDVILTINSFPMVTWSDITTAVEAMQHGQKIKVSLLRDGDKLKVEGPLKSINESKNYTIVKPEKRGKPFLGIQYDALSGEKAKKLGFDNPYGTYITQVYTNTAAERAGLQIFDYLYGIDDYVFGKGQTLGNVMQKYNAGDEATLRVLRDGGEVELDVVFGKVTEKKVEVVDKCKKAFFGISEIKSKTPQGGVVVDIVPNSTAKAMGMQKGDMILEINNHSTHDWTDITAAIYQLKVGDDINVVFMRNGRKYDKTLPIKSYCDTKKTDGHSNVETFGKEVESWSSSAPGMMQEGEPVDINNVNLMISDITTMEAEVIDYSTGASDLRVDFLSINPHPATGKFLLEFSLAGVGDLSVRLHNGAGREIYSYEMSDFSGEFSDTVNISQNGTGNYFIEIRHGNKHLSKKITLAAL